MTKQPAGRAWMGAAMAAFLWTSPVSAHEHQAPHHGTLVELGDEFSHLELLADPAQGLLTAYVLDGEAENPVVLSQPFIALRIKAEGKSFLLRLKAVANPLTGETVGNTSEFRVLNKHLVGLARFEGSVLSVNIRGALFKNVRFRYPSVDGNTLQQGKKENSKDDESSEDPKE
jgi:hypothetical protein